MHDIRAIRENPNDFDEGLSKRGLEPRSAELIALDDRRKSVVGEAQAAQERRNSVSKEIGRQEGGRRRARRGADGGGRGAQGPARRARGGRT